MGMPTVIAIKAFPTIFPSQWELTTNKRKTVFVRYKKGVLKCSYTDFSDKDPSAFFSKKIGKEENNYMSTETMLQSVGFNMCIRRGADADV